jgi:hypothetical protein
MALSPRRATREPGSPGTSPSVRDNGRNGRRVPEATAGRVVGLPVATGNHNGRSGGSGAIDLLALQRTAGNRTATRWLQSSGPVRGVQRKRADAKKFIAKNNLNVRSNYEGVRNFVHQPSNGEGLRQGLMDAWNLHQSAHFRLSLQPILPAVVEDEESASDGEGESSEEWRDTGSQSAEDQEREAAMPASDVSDQGEVSPTEADKQTPGGNGPIAVKRPTLLDVLLLLQILASEQQESEVSEGTTEVATKTLSPASHEVTGVITAHEAAQSVEKGDAIDRVVHEIAVRLNAIFDDEVPMFSEGIPSGVQTAPAQVSRNQKKRLEKAATSAKKGSTPTKAVATPQAMTEERFFREHRKKLNAPKVGPQATAMLRALRRVGRLYLMALRGASDNPLGKNVFSYLGTDYIVNEERYVRPYDGSFAKGRNADGYVKVEGSVFKAFDYPANTLSLEDFRRIIHAVLQEKTPPVSAVQMTVFIAAVAAEVVRYGPQLASVMLALTGVTDEKTTSHRSVFTEGLTMTTGGTDPGTGSHVDKRPGFVDQPLASPTRATDVSHKREGALIVSAFSQPPLSLDVMSYIKAQLASGTSQQNLVDDLAGRLVQLMNRRAAAVPSDKKPVQLNTLVSKDMMLKHFPLDSKFSARSVGVDTIVLLSAEERERLAWDMERNKGEDGKWKDGKFRTMGTYLLVRKSTGGFELGRAHFMASTAGSDSASRLNHWEGQDWLDKPQVAKEAGLEHAIAEARRTSGPSAIPKVNDRDVDKRIQAVLTRVDEMRGASESNMGPAIHEILEGKAHKDPAVRNRALALLAELEQMLDKKPSAKELEDQLAEWLPSNEWNVMPAGWVRGQASGVGYNCLIDSLLQLTTNLDQQGRLDEAKLIRYRLVQEGLAGPVDYLYGSYHARRVLQLIGANPDHYEVRTEWSYGGERKLPEVEGQGHPTVLRLWNTGGHYEPITIPPGQDPGDLAANQSDALRLRPAKPLWMAALAAQLVPDGDMGKLENSKLAEIAKTKSSEPKPSKEQLRASSATFASTASPGWEVSEEWEEIEARGTDAQPTSPGKAGTAALSEPDKGKGSASQPSYRRLVTLTKPKPGDREKNPAAVKEQVTTLLNELNLDIKVVLSGEVGLRMVLGSGPTLQFNHSEKKWTKAAQ